MTLEQRLEGSVGSEPHWETLGETCQGEGGDDECEGPERGLLGVWCSGPLQGLCDEQGRVPGEVRQVWGEEWQWVDRSVRAVIPCRPRALAFISGWDGEPLEHLQQSVIGSDCVKGHSSCLIHCGRQGSRAEVGKLTRRLLQGGDGSLGQGWQWR